jgi:hypothetical protein
VSRTNGDEEISRSSNFAEAELATVKGSPCFLTIDRLPLSLSRVRMARKLRLEQAEGEDRAAPAPGDDHAAQVDSRTTGDGHPGKRGPQTV